MEKIALWCKFIALISILSSVSLLVLPEGKSKKAFKALIAIITVYSFATPFTDTEIDFSHFNEYFNTAKNSVLSESLESYENYPLISAAESETEIYFSNLLSSVGVNASCEAVCDIEEDEIVLREICFKGELDESLKRMITEEVHKIYGEETTIIF